jgi:hypothetical protein
MYEIFYAKSLSNAVIIVNSRALERVFPRADEQCSSSWNQRSIISADEQRNNRRVDEAGQHDLQAHQRTEVLTTSFSLLSPRAIVVDAE